MTWNHGGILKPPPPCPSSLTMLLQVHLAFRTAHGVACLRLPSHRRMSLSGPTVSTSFSSSLPSWPLFIGLKVMLIWVSLEFRTMSYSPCLSKMLGTHCSAKKLFGATFGLSDSLLLFCYFTSQQWMRSQARGPVYSLRDSVHWAISSVASPILFPAIQELTPPDSCILVESSVATACHPSPSVLSSLPTPSLPPPSFLPLLSSPPSLPHHHQHPLRGPYIWVVWNFLDHFKSKPNWLCYC